MNTQILIKKIEKIEMEGQKMKKLLAEETIVVPKVEYNFLKELYKTIKRQNFLLRIGEAERNLKAGKVKRISIDRLIEGL